MNESGFERKFQIPKWIQKSFPILVSVLILYYYFHDQNWTEILAAVSHADLFVAVVAVIFPQMAVWFTNALMTSWTMTWFHSPFPFWRFFWVRGAIFMLQMINNPLGTGGAILYIKHKTNINWLHLLGIMGFRFQLVIWSICFLLIPVTMYSHLTGANDNLGMFMWAWWIFLGLQMALFVGTWNFWQHNSDTFRLGKFIVRNRESEFWRAFKQASPKQWAWIIGLTLPEMFLIFWGYYIMARAFHVQIPFWECLMVLPVVLFISNLPIAFGGFGTTTAAWVIFFGNYGTEENLIALTIFIPFARAVFRAVAGLIAMKPALAEVASLSFFSPPVKNVKKPPAAMVG